MKQLVIAMFAGSLALSSLPVLAADTTTAPGDPPKAETRTERAKDYVKEKAHNAKETTKRAAKKTKKKTKEVVASRKTTEPSSVSESKPDSTAPAK